MMMNTSRSTRTIEDAIVGAYVRVLLRMVGEQASPLSALRVAAIQKLTIDLAREQDLDVDYVTRAVDSLVVR